MKPASLKIAGFFAYFAIVSAVPKGRIDVVYPSLMTLRSGTKIVKFRARERDIEMRLEPAGDVISDGFTVVNGNGERDILMDASRLNSKLYRDRKTGAALYIGEEMPLMIHGIIDSKLRIEPLGAEEMSKDGRRAHRLVELVMDTNLRNRDLVIPKILKRISDKEARRMKSNECVIIKFVFITESVFTESFIDRNIGLTEYVATMFVAVQNRFDTLNLNITLSMIGILKYMKEAEAPFIEESVIPGHEEYLSCEDLLENMALYFYNDPIEYRHIEWADIVILLIKRPWGDLVHGVVDDRTSGIAYVGGVGHKLYKYGVCEDDANFMESVDTIAHESGHLVGCPHDGDGPAPGIPNSPGSKNCPDSQGYIMGNRKSNRNGNKFSPCCRKNVQNLLLWLEAAQSLTRICS